MRWSWRLSAFASGLLPMPPLYAIQGVMAHTLLAFVETAGIALAPAVRLAFATDVVILDAEVWRLRPTGAPECG